MSTNFPTSLDNETVPAGSETLGGSTPPHRQVHENLKDAVQALEAKVGADSSAVATSLDYKVANGVVLKSLVDAKGDLLVGTANDTVARKAAGANDRLLIADSAQADGLRWATPAEVRTALALVPGTDVEAHDADLTTIGGLTATTDNFMQAKAGAWASRTLAQVVTDLAPLMPGYELGYAENTSTFSMSSTTPADITGVTTTVTVGTRPIRIQYGAQLAAATLGDFVEIFLLEDGVVIGDVYVNVWTANATVPAMGLRRRAPSAGSHTYKLQISNVAAARAVSAIGAAAGQPTFVHVTQL